jgi:hypothetical protein
MAGSLRAPGSKEGVRALLAFLLEDEGQGIEEMFEILFLGRRPEDIDRR